MKNARFWHYHHGWVKLTLRPGQVLRHETGGPHEEGWSYTITRWEYDADERVIRRDCRTESLDCDGRLDRGWRDVCPLTELAARDMGDPEECGIWQGDQLATDPDNRGIRAPRWRAEESWQRDYAAEAAGY